MPLAVTHVILTIVLVDLFRDYFLNRKFKKIFTLHIVLIAGIAGLLPDIDMLLNWFLEKLGYYSALLTHGGITHSPIFGLIFLIPALMLYQKEKKYSLYFFVITFGIFFHIFLDYLLGGGTPEGLMLLYPASAQTFKLGLFSYLDISQVQPKLDALILIAWLYYEETKHKIRDFI